MWGAADSITDIQLRLDLTCMKRKPPRGISGTRAKYDELGGSSYDARYTEEQGSKYAIALDMVKMAEKDLVLDLGCGTGLFMEKEPVRVNSLVGLDVSAKLLSTAKKRLGGRTSVSLLLSDAHQLPLRTATFDKVFMFTVVQNSPQPVLLLSEASRVLKSSGELVVSGLKKSFDKESFEALLQKSSLVVSCFTEKNVHDYLAVCMAQHLGHR